MSFQYYAQLDIFVEVSTPAFRRTTATWVLSFVALLAYAAGYKASTIKMSRGDQVLSLGA